MENANEGSQAVRIEHARDRNCYFHKECLVAWITTTDHSNVVQTTHALCPNDREMLFEPERIENAHAHVGPIRPFPEALAGALDASQAQAVAGGRIAEWYAGVFAPTLVEPHGLRGGAEQLASSTSPAHRELGLQLRATIQALDTRFWEDQRQAMPAQMSSLGRDAARLRELGVASPGADVDRHVQGAQALLNEIEAYMSVEGNTVIRPDLVGSLLNMYRTLRDDASEASIRRAHFGNRGLRDSD